MAGKNTAAFGIYSDRAQVEQGIDSLLAARFRSEDISVLFPDNTGTKDLYVFSADTPLLSGLHYRMSQQGQTRSGWPVRGGFFALGHITPNLPMAVLIKWIGECSHISG